MGFTVEILIGKEVLELYVHGDARRAVVLILVSLTLWRDIWKVIGVESPVPVYVLSVSISDSVYSVISLARIEHQGDELAHLSQFPFGFLFSLLVVLALIDGNINFEWVGRLFTPVVAQSEMVEPGKHAVFREHE